MKRAKVLVTTLAMIPSLCLADYSLLASEAVIKEVSNTSGNKNSFFVKVISGTGPCTGTQPTFISFPIENAGDPGDAPDIQNRAFSLALAAYSTGDKVEIGGYAGADCAKASRIKLIK